jgi:UDP-N-acetylmuramoylalanine--D-glutamate ligase
MPLYHLAKHRIFSGSKHVVVNARDPLTLPVGKGDVAWTAWRDDEPDLQQLGIRQIEGESWIAFGFESLTRCADLPVVGEQNIRNVLAALAICRGAGLEFSQLIEGVGSLRGLPHRCELIAEMGEVSFINDSKATNVGAAVSAISGLANGENIILIAGGEAKGQSFEALNKAVQGSCKQVILIGAAASEIANNLPSETAVARVDSLDAAVEMGASLAVPGDVVLLSPACASFDMFANYQQRGDRFREAVLGLSDEVVS